MKLAAKILAVIIFFAGLASSGDFQKDREIRRWLIKKPIIEEIQIEGNKYFHKDRILKQMFSQKSNIWHAIKKSRQRRIQRETMMRDTSEIKYLYLTHGFLGVKVSESYYQLEDTSKAGLKIVISEGNQFKYGVIDLAGKYDPGIGLQFYQHIGKLKNGRPVNPFQLQQTAFDIKSALANNGYPYAKSEFVLDTTVGGNLANVTFIINADSLVHYGDIKITGVGQYDTSLARRELTFKKGDIYQRKDIIESQKRLFGSGYYLTLRLESVMADTLLPLKRLSPDFNLTLREKNPHYVSVKTGAEQDSIKDLIWSFETSWGKRNFLKSRQLELSARAAFVIFTDWRMTEQIYKASITEPWFLGIKMPLTLSGQVEPPINSAILAYKKQAWAVSIETTKKFGEKWATLTGLQYEKLKIYEIDTTKFEDVDEIKEQEGISVRRKFYLSGKRDSRNSLFLPTKGSVTSFRLEYVGGFLGGDASFYLFESSWSRYQRLWPGWIAATRIKGGFVQEIGESQSVPVDDRFYIGGANTVRGFDENKQSNNVSDVILGPQNGSDIILIFNQEFRYPIIGKLWGSLFFDVGNGYRNSSQIKWDNFAFSYGLGIQFISPAGPIRLDYARRATGGNRIIGDDPITLEDAGPGYEFHFTILYAF